MAELIGYEGDLEPDEDYEAALFADTSITGGFDALRGATIDSVQLIALASQLANHLGITVAD